MGYAGLNLDALRHELARQRFEVELLEDDRAWDHCLLKISAMRFPHETRLLRYENDGTEPRITTISWRCDHVSVDLVADWHARHLNTPHQASLRLTGRRSDDPAKIAAFVVAEYMPAVPHSYDG